MLSVPQRYRRTDRRTTYDSNTALALRASRGKNQRHQTYPRNTDHVTSQLELRWRKRHSNMAVSPTPTTWSVIGWTNCSVSARHYNITLQHNSLETTILDEFTVLVSRLRCLVSSVFRRCWLVDMTGTWPVKNLRQEFTKSFPFPCLTWINSGNLGWLYKNWK